MYKSLQVYSAVEAITNNMLYFNTDYIGLLAMKITIPIMSVVLYQSTWVYIYIYIRISPTYLNYMDYKL